MTSHHLRKRRRISIDAQVRLATLIRTHGSSHTLETILRSTLPTLNEAISRGVLPHVATRLEKRLQELVP